MGTKHVWLNPVHKHGHATCMAQHSAQTWTHNTHDSTLCTNMGTQHARLNPVHKQTTRKAQPSTQTWARNTHGSTQCTDMGTQHARLNPVRKHGHTNTHKHTLKYTTMRTPAPKTLRSLGYSNTRSTTWCTNIWTHTSTLKDALMRTSAPPPKF